MRFNRTEHQRHTNTRTHTEVNEKPKMHNAQRRKQKRKNNWIFIIRVYFRYMYVSSLIFSFLLLSICSTSQKKTKDEKKWKENGVREAFVWGNQLIVASEHKTRDTNTMFTKWISMCRMFTEFGCHRGRCWAYSFRTCICVRVCLCFARKTMETANTQNRKIKLWRLSNTRS